VTGARLRRWLGTTAAIGLLALAGIMPARAAPDCSAGAEQVDARCYPGNLQLAVNAALAANLPLLLPRGTYKLAASLVIDYSAHAGTGFEVISQGAVIDGTAVSGRPALQVVCSGSCFYFHQEGTLFVNANTSTYAVVVGKPDFSAQNSVKLDHLIVNNASPAPGAGGIQFNYVLDSDIFVIADSAGGASGIALEQLQFSRLAGAGSAASGAGLSIENGYSFADTVQAIDLEASAVCLRLTSANASNNLFTAPYVNCPVALATTPAAAQSANGFDPVLGGDVKIVQQWLD
jgi:hypothetical protein